MNKLRDMLCAEARVWYKLWSSWLAVLWGVAATVLWNDPDLLAQIIQALPPELRGWLSPVVLALATSLPIIIRLIKQANHQEQNNG